MEEFYRENKYTMKWLVTQCLISLVVAVAFTIVAYGIESFALNRSTAGLLSGARYEFISQSITYFFALIFLSFLSLMLIEIAYRKPIHNIQYFLIGSALCLFNLLLLAMAEHMPVYVAYLIVTVMTIGLISCFIWGITKNRRATRFTALILAIEYGLILMLLYLGSMALLIGSVLLFALIGVAMYFTIRLKIENEELVLK